MGILSTLKLFATHPVEARAMLNFKIWRNPTNDMYANPEVSGINRETMKRCLYLLDLTSRSFAFVIKELQGDLCRAICIFYLVLRALDTVEDDMTLDIELKEQLLLHFHEKLDQPGWNFDGSGPNEKDREVLTDFHVVIDEFGRLHEGYQQVIRDICMKMGRGMAKYCRIAHDNNNVFSLQSLQDFDLYCHYVAGVVGEGLVRIFSASKLESPLLAGQLTLANHMGLMLQKTNITRDFAEDVRDGRLFWPKAIWGKYATQPADLMQPQNRTQALHALNEMVLDALQHAIPCLEFLCLLKNQSVFNFCAIPQVMALATLNECFNNPNVLVKNVKIRKSMACQMIMHAVNPNEAAIMFRDNLRKMHQKCPSSDPNFAKLSILCGRVEQWTETRFPSWLPLRSGSTLPDSYEQAVAQGITDVRAKQLPNGPPAPAEVPPKPWDRDDYWLIAGVLGALAVMFLFMMASAFLMVYIFDESGQGFTQLKAALKNSMLAIPRAVRGIANEGMQKVSALGLGDKKEL